MKENRVICSHSRGGKRARPLPLLPPAPVEVSGSSARVEVSVVEPAAICHSPPAPILWHFQKIL